MVCFWLYLPFKSSKPSAHKTHNVDSYTLQVLFPNEPVSMMLTRMIGIIGPIDMEMLELGQETHKYFTDDYGLFTRNEVLHFLFAVSSPYQSYALRVFDNHSILISWIVNTKKLGLTFLICIQETGQLEELVPEKSSLRHHLRCPDPQFVDFLSYLLQINPRKRPTASEALEHPWLSSEY